MVLSRVGFSKSTDQALMYFSNRIAIDGSGGEYRAFVKVRQKWRGRRANSSSMDAGLTDETRKLALDRFRLLQPHLEGDRPLRVVAASAKTFVPDRSTLGVALPAIGLNGLVRKKRADKGDRRAISARIKKVSKASLCRSRRCRSQPFIGPLNGSHRTILLCPDDWLFYDLAEY
jgi:hypothetical protein